MQLYEIEIKSMALIREGKKGFITYFKGGRRRTIVKNVQKLYPQFMKPEDKPVVNITPISEKEYEYRVNGGKIVHKQHLIQGKEHIFKVEDYETVGN